MEKIKVILNALLNIIVTIIVLTSLFLTLSVVNSESYKYSTPGIWKYGFIEAKAQELSFDIDEGDMIVIDTSGLDKLKKGDTVTYLSQDNEFITDRVTEVKENSSFMVDNDSTSIEAERIAGRYMLNVPYAGYILGYVKTTIGLIVCMTVPCVVLLVYISVLLADMVHNSSRHRKRIVRKKKRRNKRYLKEGLHRDKRAVI